MKKLLYTAAVLATLALFAVPTLAQVGLDPQSNDNANDNAQPNDNAQLDENPQALERITPADDQYPKPDDHHNDHHKKHRGGGGGGGGGGHSSSLEIGDTENESGDIETENSFSIEGNNNSACLGQQQFGQTGNFTNQQAALQDFSGADDLEFGGPENEFGPESETACEQAVQQSSAASSFTP